MRCSLPADRLFLFILCFSWLPCHYWIYSWISLDGLFCVQCFVITLCSLWCILFVHTSHCVYKCQMFELLTRQRTFSSSGRHWHHSGPSFALGGFGKHSAPNTEIGGLLPQWWYLGLILFSFFCHKQPVFKVWLIYHWCQKTAQAREGTVPPQTFVPWWHPPSKPFSAWLKIVKSWRRGPLPVAVPAAVHNPFSKENQTWNRPILTVRGRWSQSAGRSHHRNRTVPVLGKPCLPPQGLIWVNL